jgi:RNA polymerase sigma-70 factor, ECF subfamily
MATNESITDLLARAEGGDTAVVDRILPLVYDELRRLARHQLRNEPAGLTLSTTELAHEAYLRLVDQTRVQWRGRAHFLGVAATCMRRILVDHARAGLSQKRGGGARRVPLDAVQVAGPVQAEVLIALDEALDRLRATDVRQARVVECRFFGGMTEEETAEALGIGLRTAKRDWARARIWLHRALNPEAGDSPAA